MDDVLQRACESSIDAAMHLVRIQRLDVPQESREAWLDDFGAFARLLVTRARGDAS